MKEVTKRSGFVLFGRVIGGLLTTQMLLFTTETAGQSSANNDAPNVLFTSIDDWRNDLHALGVDHVQTPKMDRFAEESGLNGRIHWETRQRGMISHNTSELKAANGRFVTDTGIPFAVPAEGKDTVFTSLYNNFPDRVEIPVNLSGRKLYFLVAASVSLMQSRMDNGLITVVLDDGTERTLVLRDPETIDDWLGSGKGTPYLECQQTQTPTIGRNTHAVVLEMDLDEERMIESVILETRTNETMIGMLGITVM